MLNAVLSPSRLIPSSAVAFLPLILSVFVLIAEVNAQHKGIISGNVIDRETLSPLNGAVVEILGTNIRAVTDKSGRFLLSGLDYESYQLKVSYQGFETQIKSDLILYAGKPVTVEFQLSAKTISTDEIEVTANVYNRDASLNISSLSLDYEEIRRAPGAVEDVSRMLQSAPGVSIGNDQRNDLVVRGGSPSENLIMIDGIEVPNINHFGSDGSSSGAIGFINNRFIREATLLTGGFPSIYGDKLSGIVSLRFREGNRSKFYSDINLSIAGFGGVFEGPVTSKGSFLFSVRRSYLELVKDAVRLAAVPNYWDFNLKADYEITPTDKIKLVGLLGLDKIDYSGVSASNNPYGNSLDNQNLLAAGVVYTKLLKNGYWENIISDSYSDTYIKQIASRDAQVIFDYDAKVNEMIFKSNLNYKLTDLFTLNTGAGAKVASINSYMYLRGNVSAGGYYYDTINSSVNFGTLKLSAFANLNFRLLNQKLEVNTGARADYFDYIDNKANFSPRLGLSYSVTPVTTVNFATGIFHQSPEYVWLASNPNNKSLESIRAVHYIGGIDHFITSYIKASVELYYKDYSDYAVWKDVPYYILVDGGTTFGPNIVGEAVSAGKGIVKGIDITLQKKLDQSGLYGLLNYSYSHSQFSAITGGVKPGAFDPGNQVTLIAGYQFRDGWLLGAKFRYSGGRPYTPIDEQRSYQINKAVYASDNFNSARYPYYMRIDMRVDKKFDFSKSSMVIYVELQNVFDRENIYEYFWDDYERELGTVYQWAIFPVGGISVQF